MGLFKDKPQWSNPIYTQGEEIANSITHGIGAFLKSCWIRITPRFIHEVR